MQFFFLNLAYITLQNALQVHPVVKKDRTSSFFKAEYVRVCLCVCVHVCVCVHTHTVFFLFHSYVHRHLGCIISWLSWIMVLWTWMSSYFFDIITFFPLDIYPEVGLLDYRVVIFLISWEASILFYFIATPVCIHFFPHSCQHLLYLVFLLIDTLRVAFLHTNEIAEREIKKMISL